MHFSEMVLVEELDRIIASTSLRIEQGLPQYQSGAVAPPGEAIVIADMVKGLRRLKDYRAQFTQIRGTTPARPRGVSVATDLSGQDIGRSFRTGLVVAKLNSRKPDMSGRSK